ncbi:protein of unknown function [Candidatus Filomicrobium marinum]|nr:protein of unknown function [Candidatus Filomicrobium marinum]
MRCLVGMGHDVKPGVQNGCNSRRGVLKCQNLKLFSEQIKNIEADLQLAVSSWADMACCPRMLRARQRL